MNKNEKAWWVPITNWCLNEIFVTESISPNLIYRERQFGTNTSFSIDDDGVPLHLEDTLVLYPNNFYFKPKVGHAVQLYVRDIFFDPTLYSIDPSTGIGYYQGTIYLRRGNFQIRFFDEGVRRLFFAQSMVSLEIKTIEKYNLPIFEKQGVFYVVTNVPENKLVYPSLERKVDTSQTNQLYFDKAFNHIKGFYYGLLRATLGTKSNVEMKLEENIATLKSKITALRTFLEMSNRNDFEKYESLIDIVTAAENAFREQYKREEIQFNIIRKRINEIYELQNLRLTELEEQKKYLGGVSPDRLKEYEKEEVSLKKEKESINQLLDKLYEKKDDLSFKAKEIKRPKKGSDEYEFKKNFSIEIDDIKERIAQEKSNLKRINDELKIISYELNKSTSIGKTKYDSTIEDQFYRITSSVNDLLLSSKKDIERVQSKQSLPDLTNVQFDVHKIADYYRTSIDDKLNGSVNFYNSILTQNLKVEEHRLLHLIVESIFKFSSTSNADFSDSDIRGILNEVVERWKKFDVLDDEQFDKVSKQLSLLEHYLTYRDTDIDYLEDFYVLNNFTAFILKPGKAEELERFLNLKKIPYKQFAFLMWGCFVGFAAMPKTFTNLILESNNIDLIDGIDEILFDNYINKIVANEGKVSTR